MGRLRRQRAATILDRIAAHEMAQERQRAPIRALAARLARHTVRRRYRATPPRQGWLLMALPHNLAVVAGRIA